MKKINAGVLVAILTVGLSTAQARPTIWPHW